MLKSLIAGIGLLAATAALVWPLVSCGTLDPRSVTRRPCPAADPDVGETLKAGLSSRRLAALERKVRDRDLDLHAMMVLERGRVVYSASYRGMAEGELHDIASLTKAIMGILIGIAVDGGLIASEEDPASDYLRSSPVDGPAWARVRISALLSMTSGLRAPSAGRAAKAFAEPGLLGYLLAADQGDYLRRITFDGRKSFAYESLNYQVLAYILTRASGGTVASFAEERLFKPLGIARYRWACDRNGVQYGFGSLELSIEDLAKIASLVMGGGEWEGRRLVGSRWIEKMLARHSTASWTPVFGLEYGYGWFLPQGIVHGFFAALGRGGQCMLLFPHEERIVLTLGNFDVSRILLDIQGLARSSRGRDEAPIEAARREFANKPQPRRPPLDVRDYEGDWRVEDPVFGISRCSLRVEGDRLHIALSCPLFNLDAAPALDGSASWSVDGEGRRLLGELDEHSGELVATLRQVNAVSTYIIRLRLQDPRTLRISLREPVLIRSAYYMEARRLQRADFPGRGFTPVRRRG